MVQRRFSRSPLGGAEVCGARTSVHALAAGVDFAVICEGHGDVAPAHDLRHRLVAGLEPLGPRVVLVVARAHLALVILAPRVDVPALAQHRRVRRCGWSLLASAQSSRVVVAWCACGTASSDLNDAHGLQGLDALGRKLPARAAQLPKVVVAPSEELARL